MTSISTLLFLHSLLTLISLIKILTFLQIILHIMTSLLSTHVLIWGTS